MPGNRPAYRKTLQGYKRTLDSARVEKEWQERTIKYASPDQEKENAESLSAKEKAHVFKNAVYSRNMTASSPCARLPQVPRTNIFGQTIKAATLFFEKNPELPVSSLLDILDDCIERQTPFNGDNESEHRSAMFNKPRISPSSLSTSIKSSAK